MSNPTSNFLWQMPTATDLVTDLPADFEVFGQAVDTALADLKGGTTNQVLAKNSNTDMDFKWVTDATGMTNPMTTTGDTIYSSSGSTPARLGIGSTGQVLTVAGGVPTWATPGGGTKNFTLLNTGGTALSGSTTVTVSGISDADVIFVYISGASGGSGAYNVSFRVNGLTTGIYNYFGPYINAGAGYSAANFGVRGGNSEVRATIGEWSGDPGSTMSGWFRITGAATSGQKIIDFQTGAIASGSSGQDLVWGGGYIDTSAAITSISLIQDDGVNFDAGTIRVYTSA
jgi:hypothetical protein